MPWPSLSLLIPINPGRRQAGIISQHAELGSDGYQQLRDCVTGRSSCPAFPPLSFPSHCSAWLCPCPLPISATFTLPQQLPLHRAQAALADWKMHHWLREKRRKEWEAGPRDCSLRSQEAHPQKLQDIAPRFVCSCLYLMFSLHISVSVRSSHATEASYSPSSLIGSASTGMFWLRGFLRSSALIPEA